MTYKKVLLKNGILEAYHDLDMEDFYGHPKRKVILEPKIKKWNKQNPEDKINLDFTQGEQIYKEVKLYIDNLSKALKHGISLILWGPNGSGKTLLGTSILKVGIRQGYSVQMTSLGGIIEAYTEGWYNPDKKEIFNRKIKDVDFLLIDDVGKEYKAKNNELVEVAFDNLVRYRSFRHKPFILTTNTSINKLQTVYGKSLYSLLAGKGIDIEVVGKDYRKLIQKKGLKQLLLE